MTVVHAAGSEFLSGIDPSSLPTEFRLFQLGDNKTSKGTFKLDAAGLDSIMAAYRKRGIADIAIDYDHQTFRAATNGKPAPAAGWFVPQARADGLWATNVRWTDAAATMLRAKEYRYFSPTFKIDNENRITELMPLALTNDPATYSQQALVAASAQVELAVWTTAQVNDLPDSAFLYVESGGDKDSSGKTVPRSLRHFPVRGPDGAVDMPHLRNALARIPQSNVPADVKKRLTAEAERMLQMHNQMHTSNREMRMNVNQIVGLNEDAPEEQTGDRLVALANTEKQLLEFTGKATVAEAMSLVIGAKETAVKLSEAEKALAAWEEREAANRAAEAKKALAEILDGAISTGRVALKNVEAQDKLRKFGETYGVDALREHVAMLDARPVRQYQAPLPAGDPEAQRLNDYRNYMAANPGSDPVTAALAVSKGGR